MSFTKIKDTLKKIKVKSVEPVNRQPFQLLALEIIEDCGVSKLDKGIVFKYCRTHTLDQCRRVMAEWKQEVNCPFIQYLKWLIKKEYENKNNNPKN
jgi:hypothetical protein